MPRPLVLLAALALLPALPAAAQPAPSEASEPRAAPPAPSPEPPAATPADAAQPPTPRPAPAATPADAAPPPAPRPDPPRGAAGTKKVEVPTVVLLDLEANPAGKDLAPGVASLLAGALVESPRIKLITQRDIDLLLGLEKQRQIFKGGEHDTCSESESCQVELSGAVGARYVVSGRLDRFGNTFVLSANLFDSDAAASLAKPHATAASDADLPAVARQVANELLAKVPGAPPTTSTPSVDPRVGRVILALKGGSSFISSLAALSPSGDLEVGFRFHPEWVGFLQIGFSFVTARTGVEGTEGSQEIGINVVPSVVGARHLYNDDGQLQPFWGLGLGVQLSFGDFGPIARSGVLPTVVGFGGLQYLFTDHFGAMIELKTDLAQATLGAVTGQGVGLHLDLSLGLVFRF